MAESHVVSGLVEKRSELAGLVAHHRQEIDRLQADLNHLDATIKLFAPDFNLGGIRKKQYRNYSRLFKQGECHRMSLDALRAAGGASSTTAIVDQIMALKSIPADQQKTVIDSVNNSLQYAERTGTVRRTGKDGHTILWALI